MLLSFFAIIITEKLTLSGEGEGKGNRKGDEKEKKKEKGGPLWPCVYLAPLWRYEASNVGRTHVILYSV